MEEDLNFFQMEDKLNSSVNGKQPYKKYGNQKQLKVKSKNNCCTAQGYLVQHNIEIVAIKVDF